MTKDNFSLNNSNVTFHSEYFIIEARERVERRYENEWSGFSSWEFELYLLIYLVDKLHTITRYNRSSPTTICVGWSRKNPRIPLLSANNDILEGPTLLLRSTLRIFLRDFSKNKLINISKKSYKMNRYNIHEWVYLQLFYLEEPCTFSS